MRHKLDGRKLQGKIIIQNKNFKTEYSNAKIKAFFHFIIK